MRRQTDSEAPTKAGGQKSGNIAVIAQEFSNTIFSELLSGISDGLRGWGTPLLFSSSGKIEIEAQVPCRNDYSIFTKE